MRERFQQVIQLKDTEADALSPVEASQKRIAALRAELEKEEVPAEGSNDVVGDAERSNAEAEDLLSSLPAPRGYTSSVKSQSPRKSTADSFGLDHGGSKRG